MSNAAPNPNVSDEALSSAQHKARALLRRDPRRTRAVRDGEKLQCGAIHSELLPEWQRKPLQRRSWWRDYHLSSATRGAGWL
jgi:hypothetical protein